MKGRQSRRDDARPLGPASSPVSRKKGHGVTAGDSEAGVIDNSPGQMSQGAFVSQLQGLEKEADDIGNRAAKL